ncbi:hypothetical protein FQA39_LY06374 [Lamprigera yunnana]|nr:hypothetical protein FQA39_LY06374 [Lamprigera yunnana]
MTIQSQGACIFTPLVVISICFDSKLHLKTGVKYSLNTSHGVNTINNNKHLKFNKLLSLSVYFDIKCWYKRVVGVENRKQLPSTTPKMKVELVFAALVATTLASPLEQRALNDTLIQIFTDLQPIIQCAQTAVENGITGVSTTLANMLNVLTSIGNILNCPPRNSSNALVVLQELITCVAQNSVESISNTITPLITQLPGLITIIFTLAGCGVTNITTAVQNFIRNILAILTAIMTAVG